MPPDPKPSKRIRDPDLMRRLHLELAGEPCDQCDTRPGAHLHHVHFRSRGGDDVRSNLLWLCSVCHMDIHAGRLGG